MLNNYIWKRHIHCINAVNAKQAADGTFNGGSSELLRVVIGVLGDLPCRIPEPDRPFPNLILILPFFLLPGCFHFVEKFIIHTKQLGNFDSSGRS